MGKSYLPTGAKMKQKLQIQHLVFSTVEIVKMLNLIKNDKYFSFHSYFGRHNCVYIKMVIINKKVDNSTYYLAFKLFLVYSNRAFVLILYDDIFLILCTEEDDICLII